MYLKILKAIEKKGFLDSSMTKTFIPFFESSVANLPWFRMIACICNAGFLFNSVSKLKTITSAPAHKSPDTM
jgi:hypothetical protein